MTQEGPQPEFDDGIAMWHAAGYALTGVRDPLLDRREAADLINSLYKNHKEGNREVERALDLYAQYSMLEISHQLPAGTFPTFHYPFVESPEDLASRETSLQSVRDVALGYLQNDGAPENYYAREHFTLWYVAENVKKPKLPPTGITEFVFSWHEHRSETRHGHRRNRDLRKEKTDDIRVWLDDKLKKNTPERDVFSKYNKFIRADKKRRKKLLGDFN